MLMNPHIDELAKVVVEEGVKVVTTGAGNPGKYVPAWTRGGHQGVPRWWLPPSWPSAWSGTMWTAVIAEGTESGGHVGEMTTMALVPQVVDAVKAPVIAAGGIADGRQMAAAFALGACGGPGGHLPAGSARNAPSMRIIRRPCSGGRQRYRGQHALSQSLPCGC